MIYIFYKDKSKRHFRGKYSKDKKTKKNKIHPYYIIGETEDKYASLGITHSSNSGKKHRTYELKKNPDPNDPKPSYMQRKIEFPYKKSFVKSRRYSKYRLSEEDEKYVDNRILQYVRKNKK